MPAFMNTADKQPQIAVLKSLCRPILTPSLPQPVETFRAERCTDAPASSMFSGPLTSTFNAIHFDENPFTWQWEKEDKKI